MNKKFLIILGGCALAGLAAGALAIFLIFGNKNIGNSGEAVVAEVSGDETSVGNDNQTVDTKPEEVKKDDKKQDDSKNETNDKKDESKEDTKEDSPAKEDGTPVANHGKLSLDGTQIVDKDGKAYQIKGVSTHGLAWFPEYVNKDAFQTIRDDWGANCIRLAMYSAEYNGYCTGGNKDELKKLVKNGVSYATELGMYVIIDWHVLGDQNPNNNKSEAIAFFKEMSKEYASYENVIYEICNEPNGGTTWSQVKAYAEEVIPVIKENDKDAIIIVGTPTWSQDVDKAAADPITGYTNIMYALHFYADTHKDDLRNRMNAALKKGLPIFVSEFGVCDASGNGANNYTEGENWINLLNQNKQSYCIWNLSNKAETSSLIASGCSKKSGWGESDLSDSGKWYVGVLGGKVGSGSADNSGSSSGNGNSGNNSSGNNNSGSSGSSGGSTESSKGSVKATVANTGSWNDGTYNYVQYTITVKADGGNVSGWKLTLGFGSDIGIDQSWSGSFNASGSNITVSPADYNKDISSGGSCELGVIVKSKGSLGNPTVTIN